MVYYKYTIQDEYKALDEWCIPNTEYRIDTKHLKWCIPNTGYRMDKKHLIMVYSECRIQPTGWIEKQKTKTVCIHPSLNT